MTAVEPYFPVDVGRCIYCPRERVTPRDQLGDEHVIPHALNGEWELLDASCETHAKVTSAFEGIVLSRGLGDLRETLGFKTYHPKKRTGSRRVSFQVSDTRLTDTLPVEHHPAAWVLPIYAPPTKLTGGEPADSLCVIDRVGKQRNRAVERLGKEFGVTAYQVPLVDPVAWAQMMAQIGYAFAVGYVGLDTFDEVYVLPTILEGGKLAGHYVGCLDGAPVNAETQGNLVTMGQAQRELVVYIRLFAQMEFPEYTVVVGRLRDTEYKARVRDAG